ncbi:MAG: helicase-related protein, partial [Kofleriaceae bacterium]
TQHRSTIVFVNTRRLVERAAAALEQRLGEEHVVAHHGSMSRTLRLAAEQKLKHGQVKCAVATASLELGIDVGAVDLVVQLGSPRSIATLLQRVGRSGHTLGGTPKGRMFALTRDQLVECAALVRGVRSGNLDQIALRDAPLDILAQQIVAITAAEEIRETELAELVRGAAPYAALTDERLEQILEMVSEGVSDRRGRAGAHVHRDRVGGVLRGRRGARLAAITSGGAIPDNNNYSVVQWPEEIQVGTVDEDFAIDSSSGDIFQLGNTAWRIRRIEAGKVIVEDAKGMPPTIPFWFGEAPARTRELSDEVSSLRGAIDVRLERGDAPDEIATWLAAETSMAMRAAQQLVAYLAAGRAALGALPRTDLVIAERFFDEAGGMQLVLHAPFGGRINRAWGLALRKKFCRQFDFELQAAATDDGIVISLGQPHSFALETVFGFVSSETCEDTLIQALLDRPMFEIRWRWNVTRSLTVLRRRAGKKVPPHLIKMRAADTLSVVFPAAQACPENLPGSLPGMPGDREIPDHPLVFETIRDCLVEAMDLVGLRELLERLERGEIAVLARDTVEPSPLSHELINANPYAYLDDAPLEERRTQAVSLRRGLPAGNVANDSIGTLDEAAIVATAAEVAPLVRSADELHDALLALWLVPEARGLRLAPEAADWFAALAATGRACRMTWGDHVAWVATERLGAARAILGEAVACEPAIATPSWAARPEREAAIVKLAGAHLDHGGPISTRALALELGVPIGDLLEGLLALEADGAILRGSFTTGAPRSPGGMREALDAAGDSALLHDLEWCNRRVLARIHRLTLARLRKEIEPVSAAALQRFLVRWQRVARNTQLIGADGLARIVEQLQGFETASGAWERELLPSRICNYDPSWLDQMCLAGQVVWCRLSPRKPAAEPEPETADPAEVEVVSAARKAKGKLVAPLRDMFREHYDLAEAGAEAARLAGATREQIAAAASAAIASTVPVRAATVITSLVTATAMLRNDHVRIDDPDVAAQVERTFATLEERARPETEIERALAMIGGAAPAEPPALEPETATQIERAFAVLEARGIPADANADAEIARAFASLDEDDRERATQRDAEREWARFGTPDRRRPPVRVPPPPKPPAIVQSTLALPTPPPAARAAPFSRAPVIPENVNVARVSAGRATRSAPSRSAPLALMLRGDVSWLRAAAAIDAPDTAVLGPAATRIRDHLAHAGASFLPDLVTTIDLPPDEIEDALWELVGAGLATADGFASLRVLVDRKRGEVKSHFDSLRPDRATATPAPVARKWADAIRKARTHDRSRPAHALRALPTAAGRWSLLPPTSVEAIDAEASARQLLLRYGVVFRDLINRESCLPPWRDLLVALRRLEARGEIRGGRFVSGFVGEQFALPEALDELRAVRNPGHNPEVCRVAATDPLNLVGVLSPGPRVPAIVGNAVLYLDGHAVASLEAGAVVQRAPLPAGARIDDDLTYHPPPRQLHVATQAALPL